MTYEAIRRAKRVERKILLVDWYRKRFRHWHVDIQRLSSVFCDLLCITCLMIDASLLPLAVQGYFC